MSDIWDDRKKALEEEYFRRKEQEALEKLRKEMAAENEAKDQATAALRCPRCDGTLATIIFEEVQIERCNRCRGVWLDAGALERLRTRERGGWLSRLWQSVSGE